MRHPDLGMGSGRKTAQTASQDALRNPAAEAPPGSGNGLARSSLRPDQHTLHKALVDVASARYLKSGGDRRDEHGEPGSPVRGSRFAYHFARGKLGIDPLFIDLLRLGILPEQGSFLDLGCGQAVFAAWLLAARQAYEVGNWPTGWAPPPQVQSLHGLELMPRDVARAQAALADEPRVRIELGDICKAAFEPVDVITIFDVLHYFGPAAQDDVLRRIRAALRPGGLFVARVGDAAGGLRFALSRWVDQIVTFVRGHGFSPMYCRPVEEWVQSLRALGFDVQTIRTEGGPPFANTMLIARLPRGNT